MACAVCYNLAAEETAGQKFKPNQVAMKFISVGELQTSAHGKNCPECCLIWEALSSATSDLETCNDFLELAAAPHRPLCLSLRSKSLSLEIFCRDGM
jgi:hypothetical protein